MRPTAGKLEMTPPINPRRVKVHLRPAVGLTAGRSYVDGRAAGRWIDVANCEAKPIGVLVICFWLASTLLLTCF